MQFDHTQFTIGFRQAVDHGIDCRDYEKVDRLPEGIPLMAVAGVWGDYSDIRCLFIDQTGKTYRRNLYQLLRCCKCPPSEAWREKSPSWNKNDLTNSVLKYRRVFQ